MTVPCEYAEDFEVYEQAQERNAKMTGRPAVVHSQPKPYRPPDTNKHSRGERSLPDSVKSIMDKLAVNRNGVGE